MPELARFFGIVVRMHYDDHNPPHVHVEYQDDRALLDFRGNVLRGTAWGQAPVSIRRAARDRDFVTAQAPSTSRKPSAVGRRP